MPSSVPIRIEVKLPSATNTQFTVRGAAIFQVADSGMGRTSRENGSHDF